MLKRPIISEKSMDLTKIGLYTFEVAKNATKKGIAKLVAEKFKVEVISVKTVNVKGKVRMQRSRKGYYTVGDIKKAIVQVKKGQKIALFENVGEEEKVEATVTTGEGEPIKIKEKKSMLGGPKVKIEKTEPKKKGAK
jgi:large subunit ribosomal protein L23